MNERLEEIMVNSFDDVVGYAEKHSVQQPHRRLHAGARSRGRSPSSCAESTPESKGESGSHG